MSKQQIWSRLQTGKSHCIWQPTMDA